MEFDRTWILLGLPAAFALGWLASRLDLRQLRIENRRAPKAYFKGLNYLLNEQQDKAIDAFIDAVQTDPDTSELHFALGNLFRRRGEYERAVRVHEHLLSRADLSRADGDRAQHALAMDFLKAGLLDRAESALAKLEGTAFETQARLARLALYERTRDWAQASEIARRLEQAEPGQFAPRLAHYLCEQASALDDAAAQALLRQAMDLAPTAARPRMDLAARLQRQQRHAEALNVLLQATEDAPAWVPLMAAPLADLARKAQRQDEVRQRIAELYAQQPCLDLMDALVALEDDPAHARQRLLDHLQREPSLVAAAGWLAGEPQRTVLQRALDHAVRPLRRYRCAACGFEAKQHFWQCPGCQAWDSYPARRVEEL
ncbi:MAG: lipopolysaccharide assembly protein LapB [Burkholderiaceae bacterium]